MSQAPILRLPNFEIIFEVDCNTSHIDINAMLNQKEKPVACFSEKLTEYSTSDLEFYATVQVLNFWRCYLIQREFVTDHKALCFLGTNAYLLDLPITVGTSPVFNVSDLSLYEGNSDDFVDIETLPLSAPLVKPEDQIEDVVDVKAIKTRHGENKKFLVKWSNRSLTDCTWIDAAELKKKIWSFMNELLIRSHQEMRIFHHGRIDAIKKFCTF